MDFNDSASIDAGSVIGGGGGGGRRGGGAAIGGGMGLLLLVLSLLFGQDLTGMLGGSSSDTGAANPALTECKTGADVAANQDCRWPAYVTSIQNFWGTQMDGYQKAPTRLFSGQVSTACGTASSDVGPFYCPGDQTVYIDPEFVGELLNQLGAQGGYAAEAYILAHEYGHHVSNLTGVLGKAQAAGQQTGPSSPQVRLELQADCYAGVWFKDAVTDTTDLIENITQDDLDRIVDAASAVGDDKIQMKTQGGIRPESWTHGSAAMRKLWVAKGFNSGDPNVCDTFSTDVLDR
ncbi:MAG TPA: neutral zinc metallopeptidase [Propionibacteriaceae bacterium]|nr:neutral zinc metallopeptidase [Propionibacteriaceae bacterium]